MIKKPAVWQRRKILVLGMTYPAYSRKYVENVCTGGIFADTLEMCRLHPVPHRYWAEGDRFKSWQWIEADVKPFDSDPRPESWKLGEHIQVGDVIPPGATGWAERRRYLEQSPHLFNDWASLRKANKERGVSLAIMRPSAILGVKLVRKPAREELEWKEKEKEILAQPDMFRTVKPLDWVPFRFQVEFRCKDGSAETSHKMGMLKWGLHELYRKYKNDPVETISDKVLSKMRDELDMSKRDVFLFLGTFRERLFHFGLMDSASPPKPAKEAQLKLF